MQWHGQTNKQTDGHGNSMTDPAQRAKLVIESPYPVARAEQFRSLINALIFTTPRPTLMYQQYKFPLRKLAVGSESPPCAGGLPQLTSDYLHSLTQM